MRDYDEDDSESGHTLLIVAGVLAGVVAGAAAAQRFGGWRGARRLFWKRRRLILRLARAALPAGTLPMVLKASGLLELLSPKEPPARKKRRRPRPSRVLDEHEVEEYERAAAGLDADDDDIDDDFRPAAPASDDIDEADDDSPEALEERVLEAFLEHPVLRGRAIEIAADDDGWVELSGRVRDRSEARLARDVARSVDGVNGVAGILSVRGARRVAGEPSRHSPDAVASSD
jgi:hypothetical protein